MIEARRLTRTYGPVRALDGISFELGRGEVAGLLGPNGAGKSTTMRVLTTYIAPTSGRALVNGRDVLDEPLEARRAVGYLPENVPLYPEMRVREFLRFRAKLKDVPRSIRRRAVSEAVSRCGLGEVEDRTIGKLSRGFRQRVGLADAILADPPILILDEPTAGMDPIQVREVRALIRELGERHTVLLSTHIMSEVEAVCSRVVVIARGRIALDGRLEDFRADDAIRVEARGPGDAIRKAASVVPGVAAARLEWERDGVASVDVTPRPGEDPREGLSSRLSAGGWPIRALERRRRSLEELFVEAVNRADLDAMNREAV
ncbi:ATP-binding cassette domain-containing protein [Paludisphaera sp.]|uniref:ABC transporter ATP-binding protein n=1 Tax=Paludisphaera sp. TaxID=2017432 RepID=UPI00301BE338